MGNWTITIQAPRIGDIVHYVSYGTPGGEYGKECRAAIVTQVGDETIGLCVLNPSGQFFNPSIKYNGGAETPGRADCGMRDNHGDPHRYCSCGWIEAAYIGAPGTRCTETGRHEPHPELPGVVRPVLDAPIRMDPATGACEWET